jgi:predicted Fe-S protein YdhL (DUF1289 family)
MTAIATPCIRHCTIDPLTGLCVGCGRTLSEIGRWMSLDEGERKVIMSLLPARLAAARSGAKSMSGSNP